MRITLAILLALLWAFPANAAFTGGASGKAATVQEAKNMADDAYVTLVGNIVSQIKHDKYIFKDATGEINVEIDRKYLPAQDISPADKVRITGKVDKDFGEPIEIDVKNVEIIK